MGKIIVHMFLFFYLGNRAALLSISGSLTTVFNRLPIFVTPRQLLQKGIKDPILRHEDLHDVIQRHNENLDKNRAISAL